MEGRSDTDTVKGGEAFVETPQGLFTASGVWFSTTREALGRYAAPVLERVPLPLLLSEAVRWLRSPQTLAVWLLPVLLLVLEPLPAALAAATLYVGWAVLGPSFVSRALSPAWRVLEIVWLQGLYYVFVMSMLAGRELFAAMWVGLGGFVVLRWGLLERVASPLVRRLQATLYRLPVPDQVLRALIVRVAMRYGLSLPELDRIERQVRDRIGR